MEIKMKRNSIVVLVICFFFLTFSSFLHAEEIPDTKEEAIEEEMQRLQQVIDEPGTYPVIIQYMLNGNIVEHTIHLIITETSIESIYQTNQGNFFTTEYTRIEDDLWDFNASSFMQVVRFFLSLFIIILVIVFIIQWISVEVLLKEIQNLFIRK
jgi:hypothetical protein